MRKFRIQRAKLNNNFFSGQKIPLSKYEFKCKKNRKIVLKCKKNILSYVPKWYKGSLMM